MRLRFKECRKWGRSAPLPGKQGTREKRGHSLRLIDEHRLEDARRVEQVALEQVRGDLSQLELAQEAAEPGRHKGEG